MREIEFRGKRTDNGKWAYGSYLKHQKVMPCPIGHTESEDDYEHLIIYDGFADWNLPRRIDAVQVDPATVGQYTGLKDKNGVEIYDGDIFKTSTGVVAVAEWEHNARFLGRTDDRKIVYIGRGPVVEVIGNKWEGINDGQL